jgi:chitinase
MKTYANIRIPPRPSLTIPQNVKALMSIGGWGGSRYFSSAVATDANRTAFAQAVMKVVSTYSLDGIEFECVYLDLFQCFQI